MSEPTRYTVTPGALVSAEEIGLTGDLEPWLRQIARLSAPITHAKGNRRFERYLLTIRGDVIERILRFDPETGRIVYTADQQRRRHEQAARIVAKHSH